MLADLLLVRFMQEEKKPILKVAKNATEILKITDGWENAVPASKPQGLRSIKLKFTMPCTDKVSLKPTTAMVEFIALINQNDPYGNKLLGVVASPYCTMTAEYENYQACDMNANLITVSYLRTDMRLAIPQAMFIQHNSYKQYFLENVRKKLHEEPTKISLSHDFIMQNVTDLNALGMEELCMT